MTGRGSAGLATDDLGDVLARVRRVVEERRRERRPIPPPQALDPDAPVEASDFFPWRRPAPGAPPPARVLAVNDLIELSPRRFVVRAHHAVLGRDPSQEERAAWEARVVRHVWQRLAALGALRLSREGRARGVRLRVRWGPLARAGAGFVRRQLRARGWRL